MSDYIVKFDFLKFRNDIIGLVVPIEQMSDWAIGMKQKINF